MTEPVRVHMRVAGHRAHARADAPDPAIEVGRLRRRRHPRQPDDLAATPSSPSARPRRIPRGCTLFPAVTNPFTRHASVLAGAIQTVEELAPGRVKFVMGTGYTSASTIGRKPATLAEMRDCIATIKRAARRRERATSAERRGGWATRRPAHPGADGRLGAQGHRGRGRGRRRRAAAGGLQPRHRARRALELARARGQASGTSVEDLEIIWAVRTAAAADHRGGARQARPDGRSTGASSAGAATGSSRPGLKLPQLEIPDAVWKIYPDLSHAPDWEAAIAATSFVPDEVVAQLCEAMGLIGTAGRLRRPHRRADQARRAEPLPHAARDLHAARPRDRRVPRHRVPPPRRRRPSVGVRSYIPTLRSGSGLEIRHSGERGRDESDLPRSGNVGM